MDNELRVTYLHHSGFAVAYSRGMLIFDYSRDVCEGVRDLSLGVITRRDLLQGKMNYVLVSHAHGDHFNPIIFEWAAVADMRYVLSADIPEKYPGERLSPGETRTFDDGIEVAAYGSTDEGVSFLVRVDGFTLFHAGDLNWWHWRDESTAREIDEAETAFKARIEPLIGQGIDIAFFPVDPRQGTLYDAGASYFALAVKPKVLVPMHYWDKPAAVTDFARRTRQKGLEIIPMLARGESFTYRRVLPDTEP